MKGMLARGFHRFPAAVANRRILRATGFARTLNSGKLPRFPVP